MLTTRELFGLTEHHLAKAPCGTLVNKQTLIQWNRLVKAASKDGIDIAIASGFRSFDRQLMIWNKKCVGITPVKTEDGQQIDLKSADTETLINGILRFSALPGTSRHHWGTDIDVFSPSMLGNNNLLLEPWEYSANGPMAQLTHWLTENMAEYEFYMPYDKDRNGVSIEPWHISHGSIAAKFEEAFDIDDLTHQLMINELECKEYVLNNLKSIVERYVLNIGQFHV